MAKHLKTPIRAKALLFDMDGTLLLSHAVVDRVWRRWANRHGLDADVILKDAHGRRLIDTMREVCPPGLSVEEEAARLDLEEREDTDGIVAIGGALEFLRALPADRWAIVTSADARLAAIRLGAAGISMPPVRITAEDVKSGKPDPEGYREGARRLGFDPTDCVVFEDAPAGIAAGHAAGAEVVVVASLLKPQALGDAHWITDYRDVSVRMDDEGWLIIE
ncbi:MAG: HAD-IA family hydrolase [Rhizobiaceae bacterium]|nr:HAD-IA family hydrolase [Rhizobiaceae bacterium]